MGESARSTAKARGGSSPRSWLPTTPRGWLLVALAGLVVAGVAFAGVYTFLFTGSSAKPLSLSSAPASSGHLAAGSVVGTWSLVPGSVVGYRVREKLVFLPAKSDAVGRTSDVAGSLSTVRNGKGLRVTAARFIVDVRTFKSDRSMRDARIHTIGLQSDQYPTAGFTLTRPIVLPATALQGHVVHVSATGLLTVHGTTRSVTIPITERLKGSQVEAVGSITFPFTEFGMQAPNVAGFVSVENHATMEFDLRFQHGASARDATLFRTIAAAKPGSTPRALPGMGPGGPPGPGNKGFQAFAQCMSRHGVTMAVGQPGGPPPAASGGAPPAGSGPPPGSPPGLNRNNPKVAAALKACGNLQPRFGPGPLPGSGPTQTP